MTVYDVITDRIVASLEAGIVPWRKPWVGAHAAPKNLVSGKDYRGVNTWLLTMAGYACPYWVTFNQAKGLGGSVRKGEKGTPVVFWTRKDRPGDVTDGEPAEVSYWIIRYYTVFNAMQCDGLTVPTVDVPSLSEAERVAAAEAIVANMPHKPSIEHGRDAAYYRPSADTVGMPDFGRFRSAEGYYATLYHELAHSTGHGSRLDRPEVTRTVHFGSGDYSREELVAEMASAYLCGQAGIDAVTVPNAAAYLSSWIKALRGDSKLVIAAASKAQKAADYILGV